MELAGHQGIVCATVGQDAEVQGEQAQVEDGGDQGQHTHPHRKVGQKLVIRKLLIWKKPPEVLEEKECAEKAGVDTKILHTKKKVQKYKMTLRVNIFTRILLP